MSSTPSKTKKSAINVTQALLSEPQFVLLSHNLAYSKTLWQTVKPLFPEPLYGQCKAASYHHGQWCILAQSPSAAAKVKQLIPTIAQHLRQQGYTIESIRVKLSKTFPTNSF